MRNRIPPVRFFALALAVAIAAPAVPQEDRRRSGGACGPGVILPDYGTGSGLMMDPGYAPGPRAMAPCMMDGFGQSQAHLQLSVEDIPAQVQWWVGMHRNARVQWWVDMHRNPRLRVDEKTVDTIVADIVTKKDSRVQRFLVDRHTGMYQIDSD